MTPDHEGRRPGQGAAATTPSARRADRRRGQSTRGHRQPGPGQAALDLGVPEPIDQYAAASARWWADATTAVEVLARSGRVFHAGDVRPLIDGAEPPHPNHWGRLFGAAVQRGMIARVDYMRSCRRARRGGVVATWRGVE